MEGNLNAVVEEPYNHEAGNLGKALGVNFEKVQEVYETILDEENRADKRSKSVLAEKLDKVLTKRELLCLIAAMH